MFGPASFLGDIAGDAGDPADPSLLVEQGKNGVTDPAKPAVVLALHAELVDAGQAIAHSGYRIDGGLAIIGHHPRRPAAQRA